MRSPPLPYMKWRTVMMLLVSSWRWRTYVNDKHRTLCKRPRRPWDHSHWLATPPESGSVDDHRASVDGSGTGTRAPSRVVGGAVPEFGKEAVKLASMAAGSPQLGAAARLTAHNAAAHGVAECREVEREHAERHMQAAHGVTNVLSGTPCIRDAEDIYDFDRYYSRSGAAQGHPNGPQRSLAPRVHNASQSSDLVRRYCS